MLPKIKQAPGQLNGKPHEAVWPQDEAVDLEQSDLDVWCRKCGDEGLGIRDGEKPSIIKWRELPDDAFTRVMDLWQKGAPTAMSTAFRHGVLAVAGVDIRRTRIDDVPALDDWSMARLGEYRMKLPYHHALERLVSTLDDREPDPDVKGEPSEVSMPVVIGTHILAATFRQRKDNA